MPDTFYRIANGYIVTCNEDMSVPLNSQVLVRFDAVVSRPRVETMLHRANTQPGLVEALEGMLADMDELFASSDHLKMALGLAEIGTPLTFSNDGPETVKKARAAIAAAKGE